MKRPKRKSPAKIVRKQGATKKLKQFPNYKYELPYLFEWLEQTGLTSLAHSMDATPQEIGINPIAIGENFSIAQRTERQQAKGKTQKELKELRDFYQNLGNGTADVDKERLWQARKPEEQIRALHWHRLPAEAMAFYRSFHYPPFDQWGIYLLVEPLLDYHQQLYQDSQQLKLFSAETLMHLILFEIFNHEFFHHLVESTVTTIEILEAAQGRPRPIYLDYKQRQYQNGGFHHSHQPLEEALANAYAYNALGFISRIKAGFKTVQVKAYQQAIRQHWKMEPPGYRDAGYYTGGEYLHGGAHLLSQILGKPGEENRTPLGAIVKHVMPTGFSAFAAKPDIPVWLVGSKEALEMLEGLVPAPLEAYTQLFWPYDTSGLDTFIQQRLDETKKRKTDQI